jgi:hypothetical protein
MSTVVYTKQMHDVYYNYNLKGINRSCTLNIEEFKLEINTLQT